MKVAFFGESRHPNAAYWMDDLCSMFGLEVHAIDFEKPALPNRSIHQHVLPARGPGKLRYLFSGRSLRRILRKIRPDVVVAQRVTSYGFTAARAGVRPLILSAQGQNIVPKSSPPGSWLCARHALRQADLIHAFAEHMAAAMRRLGADPSRIRVLPIGVRTDIFHPGPHTRGGCRIVSSRQLAPYYRTDLLIRAVSRVRALGTPAELWIAGEGPERPRLESLARELGCESAVRFLGGLRLEDLAEAYRQASVYVSMVPTDGVSGSLLEAMSCGLIPVVVNNEPNRVWIEPGQGGLLVPPGDEGALAHALIEALTGRGVLPHARERNRDRIVSEADRRRNLGRMIGWWRDLAEKHVRDAG